MNTAYDYDSCISRYFDFGEDSDNEYVEEDLIQDQEGIPYSNDLKNGDCERTIKRLCTKRNISGDFDVVMSLMNILMY